MLSIKEELHKKIDLIDDEEQLQMLNETAEAYLTSEEDFVLTQKQLQRLDESLEQAKNGQTITHEEVQEKLKKWFTK